MRQSIMSIASDNTTFEVGESHRKYQQNLKQLECKLEVVTKLEQALKLTEEDKGLLFEQKQSP